MATAQLDPRAAETMAAPELSLQERRRRKKMRDSFRAYLFIAPAFIILLVFNFLPIFYAFFLSLYSRISVIKGIVPPAENFTGLGNYVTLFSTADFWTAFFNTVGYAFGVVVFGLLLALGIALMLDKVQTGREFYRTAFFLPNVTSLVAVGAVWKVMFTAYSSSALQPANINHPGGILNWFFSGFGLPMQRWLLDERGIFSLLFNGPNTAVDTPAAFVEIALAVILIGLFAAHSRNNANRQITLAVGGAAALLTLPLIAAWLFAFAAQITNFADSAISSVLAMLLLLAAAFYLYTKVPSLRAEWPVWASNYILVVAVAAVLAAAGNLAHGVTWAGALSGPSLAMVCVIIIAIWHSLGFNIVILLAGLTNISREYYEAARLDGAQGFAMFWRMTVPLLSPTLFFLLIISTITALQSFTVIYAIFYTSGNSTTIPRTVNVLAVYYYQVAFGGGSGSDTSGFGYASAIVMFMLVFILALTFVQQQVLSKRVNYD